MSPTYPGQFLALPLLFYVASWLATIAVHVVFAMGVFGDATGQQKRGVDTSLVSPAWWTLATLFGGVVVAALYWVVHHSTLRRESPGKDGIADRSGLE